MRAHVGGRRGRRIAAGVAAAIVVVLALAQLVGPGIAAEKVREEVGRYGTVKSASVTAWPAVKLLWGDADEVKIKAGRLQLSPKQTATLLAKASGVKNVNATVESVKEGPLRLTAARLTKHGSALRAEGTVSEEDVKEALPSGYEVALVKSEDGAVEVRASGGLFGVSASIDAVAKAKEGKLVVAPLVFGLEGLKLTLFESQRVYVEGVEARVREGLPGAGNSYELSMWARLR